METTEKPVEKKNPAGFEMTDKLERAIRKRISVEMADSFRRLEARFAEETRQREIAEKVKHPATFIESIGLSMRPRVVDV